MRRIAAILLLGAFSFLLIAPAVAQDPEARLPACCRTHGKHHCMMPTGLDSGSPSFRTQNERCPLFPGASALGPNYQVVTLSGSPAFFASIAGGPTAQAQNEARYRISHSRTGQKRGPPTPLS